MRIAIIAHLKHPIASPFAGGLETFTHALATGLQSRGHRVTLFASADSDPRLNLRPVVPESSVAAHADLPEEVRIQAMEMFEDQGYEDLVQELQRSDEFDVIHNNSLHPTPLDFACRLETPMITTLHVPPLPRLANAIRQNPLLQNARFVNVSNANRASWSHLLPNQDVILNGIDLQRWRPHDAPSGIAPRCIWFGRICRDKGPHLAVEASRLAGLPIDIVGPIEDDAYFRREVRPRLGRCDRFLGHRDHAELARIVSRSAVSVITPCWDEPFGLVAAESIACGTPVAAFARGGLTDIVTPTTGRLAHDQSLELLAQAIGQCLTLDRRQCALEAQRRFCWGSVVDRYVECFEQSVQRLAA